MGNLKESTTEKAAWQLLTVWKNSDNKHALQVTDLSVTLFNQLQKLHRMGPKELEMLRAAAILHDIGWKDGRKRHHKTSRDFIISSKVVSPYENQRVLIGLITRYHRKALPKSTHKYFRDLDNNSKELVTKLAAILRFADGLDSSHKSPVKAVKTNIIKNQISVHVLITNLKSKEVETGKLKSDLLARVFNRKVSLVFLQEQQLPK
ncbi:MAG: HD domain-containing protein [Elusimicrobia bacterium]|nr:HD domain-containing protein [Candidatus Liberimonas magnetica]